MTRLRLIQNFRKVVLYNSGGDLFMRTRRPFLRLSFGLIVLAIPVNFSSAFQQQAAPVPFKAQDEDREQYQRPNDVLKALELSSGDWAADVGAGNGYYSQRMAALVGPAGKVFAEDIAEMVE